MIFKMLVERHITFLNSACSWVCADLTLHSAPPQHQRKFFDSVDVGLSGGSSLHIPGSEDPHRC
jgi:hypothetical protein